MTIDEYDFQEFEKQLINYYNGIVEKNDVDDCNVFSIFGIKEVEIRHSFFLKYLFDYNINGCINTQFVAWFADQVVTNDVQRKQIKNSIKGKKYNVKREFMNIDLFIDITDICVIVIENKINAKESKTQLDNYYDKAINYCKKKKYTKDPVLVFLTPEGRKTQYATKGNWKSMSYKKILNKVADMDDNFRNRNSGKNRKENSKLLKDYREILEKVITMTEKDTEINFYERCMASEELKKPLSIVTQYMKNTSIREIVLDQFLSTMPEIKKGTGGAYSTYRPDDWAIKKGDSAVYGQLSIFNRTDYKDMYIQAYLAWDDKNETDAADMAFLIRDYFSMNYSKYGLKYTKQESKRNYKNTYCSLGHKSYKLIKASENLTEAENLKCMLERLDEFFRNDGEYDKLCKFFEDCKKTTW